LHIRSRLIALLLGLFLWVPALSAAPSAARERATVVEVSSTRFEVDAPVGMAGSMASAVRVIEQEWPGIVTRVGVPAGGRVTVSAERDMNDWFARERIPSQPPEWASGLTIPSRMTVLMAPANPEWERTMAHELVHIAVALAADRAQNGDAVLMSPACASFDMFDNYGHRAQVFCDAVQALALGEGVTL
jgi:hypothetical protein